MTTRAKISCFIICCNEEKKIARALESVKWCDEIIIVDSGSTDRTLEICQKYSTKIVTNPWPGMIKQKRFALSLCSNEWVLNIDADEEVSPELKIAILHILESSQSVYKEINGFEIMRLVYYLGKWWNKGAWYPEYRLRLIKRSHAEWGGNDPHDRAIVKGKTARLQQEIYHYTYDSLSAQLDSLNRLSSAWATSKFQEGKISSIFNLIFNPLVRFIKFFFVRRGYREQFDGLLLSLLEAHYVFLKYMKLYMLRNKSLQSSKIS